MLSQLAFQLQQTLPKIRNLARTMIQSITSLVTDLDERNAQPQNTWAVYRY
ncbi:MAG: hypothetical protein KTR25_11810 [Myxococcales bacterium]|nr:hypothetical protein [Myxococcales bacterium]